MQGGKKAVKAVLFGYQSLAIIIILIIVIKTCSSYFSTWGPSIKNNQIRYAFFLGFGYRILDATYVDGGYIHDAMFLRFFSCTLLMASYKIWFVADYHNCMDQSLGYTFLLHSFHPYYLSFSTVLPNFEKNFLSNIAPILACSVLYI